MNGDLGRPLRNGDHLECLDMRSPILSKASKMSVFQQRQGVDRRHVMTLFLIVVIYRIMIATASAIRSAPRENQSGIKEVGTWVGGLTLRDLVYVRQ
jgi:hypothetical protein